MSGISPELGVGGEFEKNTHPFGARKPGEHLGLVAQGRLAGLADDPLWSLLGCLRRPRRLCERASEPVKKTGRGHEGNLLEHPISNGRVQRAHVKDPLLGGSYSYLRFGSPCPFGTKDFLRGSGHLSVQFLASSPIWGGGGGRTSS